MLYLKLVILSKKIKSIMSSEYKMGLILYILIYLFMKNYTNELGQVTDLNLAEDMAYIEKPYREWELSWFKSFFITKSQHILDWINEAEKYASTVSGVFDYRNELQDETEEFVQDETMKKENEMYYLIMRIEDELLTSNSEKWILLRKIKEYFEADPNIYKAISLVKRYAKEASESRDIESYVFYKKIRSYFYLYFLRNKMSISENMWLLLDFSTDWYSTEDDAWFLAWAREYDRWDLYGGYGYISIYRVWNKFNLRPGDINNLSFAVRLISDYVNYSWYTAMEEYGTYEFIKSTLSWKWLKEDENYIWLLGCAPIDEIINLYLLNKSNYDYAEQMNSLKKAQIYELSMSKDMYEAKLKKIQDIKDARIAEEERIKLAKEEQARIKLIEAERLRIEQEKEKLEQERFKLEVRSRLECELFDKNTH